MKKLNEIAEQVEEESDLLVHEEEERVKVQNGELESDEEEEEEGGSDVEELKKRGKDADEHTEEETNVDEDEEIESDVERSDVKEEDESCEEEQGEGESDLEEQDEGESDVEEHEEEESNVDENEEEKCDVDHQDEGRSDVDQQNEGENDDEEQDEGGNDANEKEIEGNYVDEQDDEENDLGEEDEGEEDEQDESESYVSEQDEEGSDVDEYDEEGSEVDEQDAEGSDVGEFDEEGVEVDEYDEEGSEVGEQDEEGSEEGEDDKEGSDVDEYDEEGSEVGEQDEEGSDVGEYDEEGSDVDEQDEEGSDVDEYDEEGSEVDEYDEEGSDVDEQDEGGSDVDEYDEEGSEVDEYDEEGSDVVEQDEGGSDVDEQGEEGSDVEEDDRGESDEDEEDELEKDVAGDQGGGGSDVEELNKEGRDIVAYEDEEMRMVKAAENEELKVCKVKKFSFTIPEEKWKSLNVATNRRGDRRLTKGWTDLFYQKVRQKNLTCPLAFKRNSIRKAGSRKVHSDYFNAVAHCKFDGCIRYKFKIKREPVHGEQVKVKVTPIKPFNKINHDANVNKARFVAGNYRSEVADKIQKKGSSNTFYELLGSVEEESLTAGNTSGFGSKQVIQKISSEVNLLNRLHKDVIIEVALLKKVYEKEDDSDGPLKGCVQAISFFPFSVMLYSKEQVTILAHEIAKDTAILYFDATGKVISKIPCQPKRVLYYALLLKGRQPGNPPFPVAEFISNSHSTVDISNFLMTLLRDVQQLGSKSKVPQRIEVDFSWAMIHAVLLSCNRENISTYLERAWDHLLGSKLWGKQTKVHICSAHLIHKISGRLSHMLKDKASRRHILFVVARMVDANNLVEIENIFTNLCIVLLSETVCSHQKYTEANKVLADVVNNAMDGGFDEDESMENLDKADDEHGSTPRTSAFAVHFQRIADGVGSDVKESPESSEAQVNPYYCPGALKYLLGTYMGVLPLWSGLLLNVPHDTNSPAENWMKIVKKDILQGKSRMTPSTFIIETRCSLKGRLREYTAGKCVNPAKPPKASRKSDRVDFLESEESWGGKKVKHKSIYFPQKPKARSDSERALHWGGKIQINDKTVSVSNTCPVDNLLILVHYALKRTFVRDWFDENGKGLEVCKILLDIHDLFMQKKWSEGRSIWVQRYCSLPDTEHWDLFGSEWQQFVQHFGHIQETACISTCSKRRCLQKTRQLLSREINLGDQTASTRITLQESLRQWEAELSSGCSAGPSLTRCNGTRTCTRRKFTHQNPPVLILNVNFLSTTRQFTPSQLPVTVEVINSRYRVFACTKGNGDHFKAFFVKNGKWYKYDGLCTPEVTYVPCIEESGDIEHVVLILDKV